MSTARRPRTPSTKRRGAARPLSPDDCSIAQLKEELHCRACRLPTDPRLAGHDSRLLATTMHRMEKGIYGTDDRSEVFEVGDQAIRQNARSVAAITGVERLVDLGDGSYRLATIPLGRARSLCTSERFYDQPIGVMCTGFLVAPDVLVTAGHCIDANTLPMKRVLFGFEMVDATAAKTTFESYEVFRPVGLIARVLTEGGADYAIVRLDRAVPNRPPLRLRATGTIRKGAGVYVIGHPSGLPLKYAGGAKVRSTSARSYFSANLDAYGGNSGSPVFNATTHVVEGVLVRGETDYVNVGPCYLSNVCPTNGCDGEEVVRSSVFRRKVPKSAPALGDAERLTSLESQLLELRLTVAELRRRSIGEVR